MLARRSLWVPLLALSLAHWGCQKDEKDSSDPGDVTPPTLTKGPDIKPGQNIAEISFALSEPGSLYYLYQLEGAQAPDEEAVLQGTKQDAAEADQEYSFTIEGLKVSTAYKLYSVAKDRAGNKTAEVMSQPFTTAKQSFGDIQFISGTPTVLPGIQSAELKIQLDQDAKIYTQLKEAEAAAATKDELLSLEPAAFEAGAAAYSRTFDSLSPGSNYSIWVLVEDAAKAYHGPHRVDFTTHTELAFVLLSEPQKDESFLVSEDPDSFVSYAVTANLNMPGTSHFLAQRKEEPLPTIEEVTKGEHKLTHSAAGKSCQLSFTFKSTEVAKNYAIYVVATDTDGSNATDLKTLLIP